MSNIRIAHSAARFNVSGFVANGASWIEEYNFQVDGGVIDADADIWTWKFNFRQVGLGDDTVDLSLSTTAATLAVTNGADATTVAINVPFADLSHLEGDYIAELIYETAAGVRVLWADGIVTFRAGPVWG